jgi:uncharacterized protein (DUF2164 family)
MSTMNNRSTSPTKIRLTDERKAEILCRLTILFASEFDEKISPFRAERILTFFLQNLGPAVYNQAIQDARKYMTDRLDDLDATFHQEEPAGKPAPR